MAQGTNSQDLNAWDLNKKSRQIHEAYEQKIHDRIEELGYDDTEWHEGILHQNIFEKESFKYYPMMYRMFDVIKRIFIR